MDFSTPKVLTSRRYQKPADSVLAEANTVFETDYELRVAQEAVIASEYHEQLYNYKLHRKSFELMQPYSLLVGRHVIKLTFDISIPTLICFLVSIAFALASICFYAILQTKVPNFNFFYQKNLVVRKQLIFDPEISASTVRKSLKYFQDVEYSVGLRNHYSLDVANLSARQGNIHYLNRDRYIPISQVASTSVLEANTARIANSVQTGKLTLRGKSSVVASDSFVQAATTVFVFKNDFNFTLNTTFARLSVGDLQTTNLSVTNIMGAGKFYMLNASQVTVRNASISGVAIGKLEMQNMQADSVHVLSNASISEFYQPVQELSSVNSTVSGNKIVLDNNTVVNSTSVQITGSELTFARVSAGSVSANRLIADLLNSNSSAITNVSISNTQSSNLVASQLYVTGICVFGSVSSASKPILSANGSAEFQGIQNMETLTTNQLRVKGTYIGNITIS